MHIWRQKGDLVAARADGRHFTQPGRRIATRSRPNQQNEGDAGRAQGLEIAGKPERASWP